MNETNQRVRIDKWLWAARFFKTRQLAVKAVKNSQVLIGGKSVKPAATIRIGELLKIKRGLFELEIEVVGVSEKRGSATIAQQLYQETKSSIETRQKLKAELDNQPKIDTDRRKPDKRKLRDSRAFKRQG